MRSSYNRMRSSLVSIFETTSATRTVSEFTATVRALRSSFPSLKINTTTPQSATKSPCRTKKNSIAMLDGSSVIFFSKRIECIL